MAMYSFLHSDSHKRNAKRLTLGLFNYNYTIIQTCSRENWKRDSSMDKDVIKWTYHIMPSQNHFIYEKHTILRILILIPCTYNISRAFRSENALDWTCMSSRASLSRTRTLLQWNRTGVKEYKCWQMKTYEWYSTD